ncbi:MAG: aldolase/citrate lyase family protein [Betaproteobacteria bacterium]
MQHPRDVLLGAQASTGFLPVCDHYSGVPARMRKSLALQAELTQEFGACVFDVTLDCEDGAPTGAEQTHAEQVVELVRAAAGIDKPASDVSRPRVAVRVHPVDHPAFESDVATVVGGAGHLLCHIMIPKVESVADVDKAVDALARASLDRTAQDLPLQVLVESPAAVHRAFEIAGHPRVQSISFGLMDFVSAHGGAIPVDGMSGQGQFTHPLVVRAKLEIASACHAHGKAPSHCVVTEFRDTAVIETAARTASRQMGFTRMWSIHPDQIRPILRAFAPQASDVAVAAEILDRAQAADWAPIDYLGQLHDRASYRLFWHVLERAFRTGQVLPENARRHFHATLQ